MNHIIRIVFADSREESLRSYQIHADIVHMVRADGEVAQAKLDEVDLARTFQANAGVDFGSPVSSETGQPLLELVQHHEREAGDYIVVEGIVKNAARCDVSGVVAKVIGEDENGAFLTSEEALIDWNPLRVGAESPFRVIVRSSGRIRRTRLLFRALLGEPIPTRGLDPGLGGR